MADIITLTRIAAGFALLFTEPFSAEFTALYLYAGISDMADGAVARKTGTVSTRGAVLDTAADLVLTAVCLIRLLPVITLPDRILLWTGAVALLKMVNIILGFRLQGAFPALHTKMDKAAGMLLFLFPLTLPWIPPVYSASAVCAAAAAAAVQECCLICGTSGCFR